MPAFIHGLHAIEEQLKTGRIGGKLLIARKNNRIEQLIEMARQQKIQVIFTDGQELDRYCDVKNHKGVLFLPEKQETGTGDFKTMLREIRKEQALILLLDSITDPHNYGAILRSADQFQVDLVVTTEKRSARETETVAATSAGASVYVKKVTVVNLIHAIEWLKKEGYWVYGADISGQPLPGVNLKGKTALIMGSEGKGIRRLVKEQCDQLVRIPGKGHVDSLNVSVAAGILMYEVKRQQGFI